MTNMPFETVCALVRNRIFGDELEIPSGTDWEAVLNCALRQEVAAICYEAIKALPSDRQPAFPLMIQWDIAAQSIKEQYFLRLNATRKLCALLEAEGIRTVVLKGSALAAYYPVPSERQSSDVDILTFRDCARVDSIMSAKGISVTGGGHHTSFDFEGAHFENHGSDVRWDFNFRRSDYRMLRLLDEHAQDCAPGPEGLPALPPAVSAVYLVKHLRQHLRWNCKICIKQFADLALLLQAHPDIKEDFFAGLKSIGLKHFGKVSLCIASRLFGTGACGGACGCAGTGAETGACGGAGACGEACGCAGTGGCGGAGACSGAGACGGTGGCGGAGACSGAGACGEACGCAGTGGCGGAGACSGAAFKTGPLVRAEAAFITRFVLPLPAANSFLLQYAIVCRDLAVGKIHKIKERLARK